MSDNTSAFPEIRDRIDNGGISLNQYVIISICFLLNVADGFDVLAMSVAAPSISDAWQITPQSLGVIFSAALAGMTIGAMFISPLSDKFGRRKIILFSVAAISLSMFATAYSGSVTELVIIRFITGLGIGSVLASLASITTEFAPEEKRSFAVIFVQSGYSVGAVIVGPVAGFVLAHYSWELLFIYGGSLSAVLFVFAYLFIPESIEYLASAKGDEQKRLDQINATLRRIGKPEFETLPKRSGAVLTDSGSISSLLGSNFRVRTLTLWGAFFLAFWATYFLINWIPKLFVNAGFDIQEGISALTVFTIGGLLGALSIGVISTRFNLTRSIATAFVVSALLLCLYVLIQPQNLPALYIFMAAANFALTGGFTAFYAVAAQSYPAEIRATGVGWCIGLGRFGAIVSPIVAGFLVASDWGMYSLFMVLAIPPILLSALLIYRVKL